MLNRELAKKRVGLPGMKPTRQALPEFTSTLLAFGHGVGILPQEIEGRRFFGREFGLHRFRLLFRNLGEELNVAIALKAGASRNQPAHDNVFLQAAEIIHLPEMAAR